MVTVAVMIQPTGIAQTNRLGHLGVFERVVAYILDIARGEHLENILGQMRAKRQYGGGGVFKHFVLLSQWE